MKEQILLGCILVSLGDIPVPVIIHKLVAKLSEIFLEMA